MQHFTTTPARIRHYRHAVRCLARFVRLGALDRAQDIALDLDDMVARVPAPVGALLALESAPVLAALADAESNVRSARSAFVPGQI